MRISDWSSDVCSSDLRLGQEEGGLDVDVHHLVPARLGETLERFAPRGAGIVDEDVEPFLARLKFLGERTAALDRRERTEERRVGKEGVSTCRTRRVPEH